MNDHTRPEIADQTQPRPKDAGLSAVHGGVGRAVLAGHVDHRFHYWYGRALWRSANTLWLQWAVYTGTEVENTIFAPFGMDMQLNILTLWMCTWRPHSWPSRLARTLQLAGASDCRVQ